MPRETIEQLCQNEIVCSVDAANYYRKLIKLGTEGGVFTALEEAFPEDLFTILVSGWDIGIHSLHPIKLEDFRMYVRKLEEATQRKVSYIHEPEVGDLFNAFCASTTLNSDDKTSVVLYFPAICNITWGEKTIPIITAVNCDVIEV